MAQSPQARRSNNTSRQSQPLSPWNWFSRENANPLNASQPRNDSLSSAPAQMLSQFNRSIEQMCDMFFSSIPMTGLQMLSPLQSLMPDVEIDESEKEYIISLDLPNVDSEDDIDVQVKNGMLLISCQQEERSQSRSNRESRNNVYSLTGQRISSFQRMLTLPLDADENGIEATFGNGELHITVPRIERDSNKSNRVKISNRQKKSGGSDSSKAA